MSDVLAALDQATAACVVMNVQWPRWLSPDGGDLPIEKTAACVPLNEWVNLQEAVREAASDVGGRHGG